MKVEDLQEDHTEYLEQNLEKALARWIANNALESYNQWIKYHPNDKQPAENFLDNDEVWSQIKSLADRGELVDSVTEKAQNLYTELLKARIV